MNDAGNETWTFTKAGDNGYFVDVTERKPAGSGKKDETETSTFIVHLFRLGTTRYLDAFPTNVPALSVGTHFLVKLDLREGAFTARAMEPERVDRAAADGPLHAHPVVEGIVTEKAPNPDAAVLLLAPTDRLQGFIQEQGSEIFEKDGVTSTRETPGTCPISSTIGSSTPSIENSR